MKNQYRGGYCLKGGGGRLGQFADLKGGGLDKKEVNTPMRTIVLVVSLIMLRIWDISFLTELYTVFSYEKTFVNVAHAGKWIAKFPHMVL